MAKKKIFLIIIGVVLAIQLYRPSRKNPPEDPSRTIKASMPMPPEIDRIIGNSCNDCHSYKTNWPWYSKVAPVSWFIASDVRDGRRHVNFSDWASYPPEKELRKLGQICEELEDSEMPLKQYTWIHKGTRLTDAQRDTVCSWTKAQQARISKVTGVKVPEPQPGGMQAEKKK